MQEWARRLCFLLSESSRVHTQDVWKRCLRICFTFLHCSVVWMTISACLECQTSVKQVVHLLRRKPPSTVCAARLPVLHTWRTSADCLRRPRVNTDVENGGNKKALTGKTDDGCHDEPGRQTEEKNTSKAAEHQWKINFGEWDCVLLHVCLYVDTCLTCDGGLSRGGLLFSLNDALRAGSAPHWPWYPVAIQFRPTSSCIPPPPSRTLNPWIYFPWLLAVFGCALMKRPMALLYSFLRQLRDVIDQEEFTLWPEFL